LTRIESEAFSYSSLKSIVIPQNVQFIDGSAFVDVTLSSISIESGNQIFVIENDFLIDVFHQKLIRNFSTSSVIEIGRNIEILGDRMSSVCIHGTKDNVGPIVSIFARPAKRGHNMVQREGQRRKP
jgi:hypothetical protein